ncbi:TRAP transporter, DctM subunit [Gemmobacter megaterium]|uniref:TRAP transporter, DctM subunit n=1 Tax=Gemmobacter megaterium TaxID=1086013 RepID=A0A1N7N9G3_9RHOB|nr:TRAP transporter large permease [Gemmobacter megaterium]GGE13676.1 C4-dicarboxylate ABC transporter [Gemmobacter megaterium]SIS94839.1 TRAP transporter, DctM subunit [Gemmobacter megaterium]
MTDLQIAFAFISLLVVLLLIRVPIGVALISVSFTGIGTLLNWKIAWGTLGVIPYHFASSWLLSSVPAFLFMGFLCYHARLTEGLFHAARIWLAGLPGGLAVASVFGCAGFAAVTGSSVACSAAMGKIAVPEMMRNRYSAELATSTVAAGGTIGALIPPSILMILYGVIAQVPVHDLFLAGAGIGILTMFAYCAVIMLRVKANPELAPPLVGEVITGRDRLLALAEIWPVLLIALGVFGGLFSGVFTPTEAGAIGGFLSLVVALAKRTLGWRVLWMTIIETVITTASLMIIAIGASMLTRFLALSGAGEALSGAILGLGSEPVVIILMICLVYLLLGMFLEPIGAMLLTLPIFLPVVDQSGYSLLWFGILLTKLLEIGMITPPIGMNVFVIKGVVGNLTSLGTIFRGVAWFIVADFVLIALMIAFPALVLFPVS